MIEKIATYNAKSFLAVRNSGTGIKIDKLLGLDKIATGYMTLSGTEDQFAKLAAKKIYVFTQAWKQADTKDELTDTDWRAKKKAPKAPQECNAFMRFLQNQFPSIYITKPVKKGMPKGYISKDTPLLVQSDKIGAIVRPLDVAGEELATKKKECIVSLGSGKLMVIIYPKKDWDAGDCLHFKVLAKYSTEKQKFFAKTQWPKEKQETPRDFNKFQDAVNQVQENRWNDNKYDGDYHPKPVRDTPDQIFEDRISEFPANVKDVMRIERNLSK